jgi:hypothetical protein
LKIDSSLLANNVWFRIVQNPNIKQHQLASKFQSLASHN